MTSTTDVPPEAVLSLALPSWQTSHAVRQGSPVVTGGTSNRAQALMFPHSMFCSKSAGLLVASTSMKKLLVLFDPYD